MPGYDNISGAGDDPSNDLRPPPHRRRGGSPEGTRLCLKQLHIAPYQYEPYSLRRIERRQQLARSR